VPKSYFNVEISIAFRRNICKGQLGEEEHELITVIIVMGFRCHFDGNCVKKMCQ
jgi:hypothetical protein